MCQFWVFLGKTWEDREKVARSFGGGCSNAYTEDDSPAVLKLVFGRRSRSRVSLETDRLRKFFSVPFLLKLRHQLGTLRDKMEHTGRASGSKNMMSFLNSFFHSAV